ncbi:uncharacterized protein BJ171DRAFT_524362 [Polychytrium aggregatum]|uniref:uncharacterized protein n=1 Tax=Polychytrium aggregatum TaxID=110093 RepID=UPI0022FE56FD|nr:uncharacterized protein BJ171DRAFT_524362 [Polychytrium aggregatum]KAI9193731.1 hypothetical protein BJ171DRAFT_524362 [Polychytrium aggregatum]
MSASPKEARTSLQRLIDEPKGKTAYAAGEPFLLHVFWEAPSAAASKQLLEALAKCAVATHRDTPCVPTYFFRISANDEGFWGNAPRLVGEHKLLAAAIKKVNIGVSKVAVAAELARQGLDPSYLDLDLSAELPAPLQGQRPVALEFTEVYLDERAFMEHAGSRDYLKAYGVVMSPGLSNSPPVTFRFGTPCESVVEKILEPILKERVVPATPGFSVWQRPEVADDGSFLISVDVGAGSTAPQLSEAFQQSRVWSVWFEHPHREGTARLMAVFPVLPTESILGEIAALGPVRGEAHIQGGDAASGRLRRALDAAGLAVVRINAADAVGYILHGKVTELHPE